jgi:hypothetical protein
LAFSIENGCLFNVKSANNTIVVAGSMLDGVEFHPKAVQQLLNEIHPQHIVQQFNEGNLLLVAGYLY